MNTYKPIIGLEIHVELKTESKMFCGCAADWFGKEPNTHTCPVCLGLPGAIPVPNQKAIEWTLLISKALNCSLNSVSKFDRKHYFYPDLPKSFQISQYDEPFGQNGTYKIIDPKIEDKTIRIRRVHLEEDTGKLIHKGKDTLIDYNRSGVPLVEIVTEPDFSDSESVKAFLEELQLLVRTIGVTDANMEEGSMRLEPNISLKIVGRENPEARGELPNYKVEVKNINSFRFAKNAIEYELKRQQEMLEKEETPAQETRGYNEAKGITVSQRTKEEAHDYRYFPEPDIPPLHFSKGDLEQVFSKLPLLPQQLYNKFIEQHSINPPTAYTLVRDLQKTRLIEDLLARSALKDGTISFAKVVTLVINGKISLNKPIEQVEEEIIQKMTRKTIDPQILEKAVERVISENPKPAEEYKKGKEAVLMFLVGQVMRELKGQVDAVIVRENLIKKLNH